MNTMTVANENQETNSLNPYPVAVELLHTITRKEFCIMWKQISKDKRTKPHFVEYTYNGTTHKTKEKGWVHPEHHIIYNIIRGLPTDRGFKKGTQGYESALKFLKHSSHFGFGGVILKPFEQFMSPEKFKVLLLEIQNLLK